MAEVVRRKEAEDFETIAAPDRITWYGAQAVARTRVRTTDELYAELGVQLDFLRSSCDRYDEGKVWEAKRIASVVALLLHSGHRRVFPLLAQMQKRDSFLYRSTAGDVLSRGNGVPLCVMHLKHGGGDAEYVPICQTSDDYPHQRDLPFLEWWNEPIFRSNEGRELTRKGLTLALRDQDGGAHFDATINRELYIHMIEHDGAPWLNRMLPDDWTPSGPVRDAHIASMRQIGWELDFSLVRAGLAAGQA